MGWLTGNIAMRQTCNAQIHHESDGGEGSRWATHTGRLSDGGAWAGR
jgi:hypothetical protein